MSVWKSDEKLLIFTPLISPSKLINFVWEVISSMRCSVSSPDETPRSSSKILCCASYFQLSSQCFIWWWKLLLMLDMLHDSYWHVLMPHFSLVPPPLAPACTMLISLCSLPHRRACQRLPNFILFIYLFSSHSHNKTIKRYKRCWLKYKLMWQGSLKKPGTYISRLPKARLLVTYLSVECTENIKLKRQNGYQWDNFSDFF